MKPVTRRFKLKGKLKVELGTCTKLKLNFLLIFTLILASISKLPRYTIYYYIWDGSRYSPSAMQMPFSIP